MKIDPFSQDPILDKEYPATQATFYIDSHGSNLNAIIEIAQGKGPHPTIILLHGFPGNEKNFDLAHIFRRAGFNVLVFYYRGSWGSGGVYSFQNCINDVHSVLAYLRDPKIDSTNRIDVSNIILMGYSWGGFVALFAGLQDENINKIASISGFNIGGFGKLLKRNGTSNSEIYDLFDDIAPLQGTSGRELLDEILNMRNSWDLIDLTKKLIEKDLCLTGALNDEVLPIDIHHNPLVNSIKKISSQNLITKEFDTNHSYSDQRIALAKFLINWLNVSKTKI